MHTELELEAIVRGCELLGRRIPGVFRTRWPVPAAAIGEEEQLSSDCSLHNMFDQ